MKFILQCCDRFLFQLTIESKHDDYDDDSENGKNHHSTTQLLLSFRFEMDSKRRSFMNYLRDVDEKFCLEILTRTG